MPAPSKNKSNWFYDPKHPLWLIIRQLVVIVPLSAVLGVLLAIGYNNGWSADDWKTIIISMLTTSASLGAFDIIKRNITSPAKHNPDDHGDTTDSSQE